MNHYKKEVRGKEIGGGTKWKQHLTTAEKKRFTRIKLIVRAYDKHIESHSSTA